MAETIDLKRDLKTLYSARKGHPVVVDVPEMQFLMVDGRGHPATSSEFQGAFEALFSLAYPIRFAIKARADVAYTVMPPEGLFWSAEGGLETADLDSFEWTLMVMQPDFVGADDVERARRSAIEKGVGSASNVRFESFHEGLSAQVMHVGPYDAQGPTIDLLHAFIVDAGHRPHGKHHEIYLGDPRRAKPENLRTIIRQPIV
jgi:hypothetical protein